MVGGGWHGGGMADEVLTGDQVAAAGIDDWRAMYGAIEARFRTGDFATGLRFVAAIGDAAEEANHHPDVTLTYGSVHVLLTSHDVGGKTARDVDLARRISEIATSLGITADPSVVQRMEIGLDAADFDAVRPFWAAVLGMTESGDDEVSDPEGVLPNLWLQRTEPHAEPRQRFHLDLWVPPEQVDRRIEAALGAGGTLVSDAAAPRFWVLADPEGNKVCLCTHQTRDL